MEALSVQEVTTIEDLATVRTLLEEYWTSIGFDLATFDFGAELDELPGRYAPPEGRLALAILSGDAVGCIALRRLDGDSCEMKRLFVQRVSPRQWRGSDLDPVVVFGGTIARIFEDAGRHVADDARRSSSL